MSVEKVPCCCCGAALTQQRPVIDRRTGNADTIALCSRCLTEPDRVWRLRYQLASEAKS